jgi:alpha-L-rhamnosidase
MSIFACVSFGAFAETAQFRAGKPIWPEGREKEKNLTVGFRAIINAPKGSPITLRVAASNIYRAYVNGKFCGHGPARGPHGFYRVDEWDISDKLSSGKNVVAVEVVGYNVNSYYLLDQPAFVQAEVVTGDSVLAATGDAASPFAGKVIGERVQKVERYSFQRTFSEVYKLTPSSYAWRSDPSAEFVATNCPAVEEKKLIPRRVPNPDFSAKPALSVLGSGTLLTPTDETRSNAKHRPLGINEKIGGYPENELETVPAIEYQQRPTKAISRTEQKLSADTKLELGENDFRVIDFGTNFTGFIGASVTCSKPSRIVFAFDEILSDKGDVDFLRLNCVNIVTYSLEPGTYAVESFEPYTLRYLKAAVMEGACVVSNLYIRPYANPTAGNAKFNSPDERLNRLFIAGAETFGQNAVDIFMDCPSRERAGWLCDSFFTSRGAKDLSGTTTVEKNFFENFLLPDHFEHLPEGMLPMCYPSDHNDGIFIPNWAMWFVLQMEEYSARSGDHEMVEALKPKVLALLKYFEGFKNEDGLLEKLDKWVFVEWSRANDFVQDVNYPSNMLYAAALAATGRMYSMPDLIAQADQVRETVLKQSYNGEFFVDNALRKDGKLEVTKNTTEVCQYFAFYFNLATPESHPELWRKLRDEFGPKRGETKAYPNVFKANSFIGNMLRFEILSRYGRSQQILDESISYLLYMADRTGTLWENDTPSASCDHGFASHIVHTLYRDVLGVYSLDTVNKLATLRFSDVTLPKCEGALPTPDGPVSLKWRRDGDTIFYSFSAPEGYTKSVMDVGGVKIVAE